MRIPIAVLVSLMVVSVATADPIVDELANRTQIPVAELTDILADCDQNQMAMNMCAYRNLVEVELSFEKLVGKKTAKMSTADAEAYRDAIEGWRTDIEMTCEEYAEEEAGGGSMQTMIYTGCVADKITERMAAE